MTLNFYIINFYAINILDNEYLIKRQAIDSKAFETLSKKYKICFLKLKTSNNSLAINSHNELFFYGINFFFNFPLRLFLHVKKNNPKFVLIHGFVFPFQLLVLKLFLKKETKIIVQHHAEKPFKNKLKLYFQKKAYSNLDAYLFTTKDLAQSYIDNSVINNPSKIYELMESSTCFLKQDKNIARNILNIKHEMVFLWVGRLNANKDPFTVLNAFLKYIKQKPQAHLYFIYGSDELEGDVKNFILKNELQSHITLLGKVNHSELQNWYNAANYFISASHYEGSGYALCEAMACGCVPIVTNIPSFKKMLNYGGCGYLYNVGDSENLYQILQITNHYNYLENSPLVVEQFNNELSFNAIANKLYNIVSSLL